MQPIAPSLHFIRMLLLLSKLLFIKSITGFTQSLLKAHAPPFVFTSAGLKALKAVITTAVIVLKSFADNADSQGCNPLWSAMQAQPIARPYDCDRSEDRALIRCLCTPYCSGSGSAAFNMYHQSRGRYLVADYPGGHVELWSQRCISAKSCSN